MKKFFYRVKAGDSIISVSKKFGVPTMPLVFDNRLSREIKSGDILLICERERVYEVEPLDTLDSISNKLCVPIERLSYLNGGITYVFYGLILTY